MTAGFDLERFVDVDADLAGRRLLILGGGLWQLEYVRRARQLGLETWVTDWSATAVAGDEAHHFEPIDLKDRDATLALARDARIDAVLTTADIGVPTAAYVAERLGLPGHPPKLADDATNKFEMRQRSELPRHRVSRGTGACDPPRRRPPRSMPWRCPQSSSLSTIVRAGACGGSIARPTSRRLSRTRWPCRCAAKR